MYLCDTSCFFVPKLEPVNDEYKILMMGVKYGEFYLYAIDVDGFSYGLKYVYYYIS